MDEAGTHTKYPSSETGSIPVLLLSQCWSLISAERQKIIREAPLPQIEEAFTPSFLRALYIRADSDRDGRLSFDEIHHQLNIYMSDLISADTELPRAFTSNVVRAVIVKDNTEFVAWSDFSVGFPLAVRQRRVLWDQYVNSSAGTDVPN